MSATGGGAGEERMLPKKTRVRKEWGPQQGAPELSSAPECLGTDTLRGRRLPWGLLPERVWTGAERGALRSPSRLQSGWRRVPIQSWGEGGSCDTRRGKGTSATRNPVENHAVSQVCKMKIHTELRPFPLPEENQSKPKARPPRVSI